MPIAIYRLKKLSVAMPRSLGQTIHNFSPRRLRDLRMTRSADGENHISLLLTRMERRLGLVTNYDEDWEFHKGEFRIVRRQLRNGRLIRESVEVVPPLLSTAWTQKDALPWVLDKFEQEQTARCIIEQYLYEHTPNPADYRIVTFDFGMAEGPAHQPAYGVFNVRDRLDVQEAANSDRSEDADHWIRLFMNEK